MKNILTIRTITAYLNLQSTDFTTPTLTIKEKVAKCAALLRLVEKELAAKDYTVQTIRIATNPFPEWLSKDIYKQQLQIMDKCLQEQSIDFCALGPATMTTTLDSTMCRDIVSCSPRFSCSANIDDTNVQAAKLTAQTIIDISKLGNHDDNNNIMKEDPPDHVKNGLGNFRFCAACSCQPFIPFFPAAKSKSILMIDDNVDNDVIRFAVGLESGQVAMDLLSKCQSIANISTTFRRGMADILLPVQEICVQVAMENSNVEYLGIDSSLNPSLQEGGSVAQAIEQLEEVTIPFGGPGTLAATAAITKALQSLPGIKLTGYCGLMLPVCEDQRLAELANEGTLQITDLLCISSVCGVGVDTVPIPGDCTVSELSSLILDVAGLAGRWNKSLGCRVFPVPGCNAGQLTQFDSPYMVNANIFLLK